MLLDTCSELTKSQSLIKLQETLQATHVAAMDLEKQKQLTVEVSSRTDLLLEHEKQVTLEASNCCAIDQEQEKQITA